MFGRAKKRRPSEAKETCTRRAINSKGKGMSSNTNSTMAAVEIERKSGRQSTSSKALLDRAVRELKQGVSHRE